MITLDRFAYSPVGTFGELRVNDFKCYTVERPWLGNKPQESCIPEGIYDLGLRDSPVVQRSSNGRYSRGWEVKDVINRTYIMIHPGNNMYDVIGCIAVGSGLGFVKTTRSPHPVWAVTNSQTTFQKLMTELAKQSEWQIHIRQVEAAYP